MRTVKQLLTVANQQPQRAVVNLEMIENVPNTVDWLVIFKEREYKNITGLKKAQSSAIVNLSNS